MYEVLLIFLGFLIGLIPPWLARNRRLKTHWSALNAEVSQCTEKAKTLSTDTVRSPLYRFPVIAYRTSFPILLADGGVSEDEVKELGSFFGHIEDINRGLDNAAEANMHGGSHKVEDEFKRNRMKSEKLLEGDPCQLEKVKRLIASKIA